MFVDDRAAMLVDDDEAFVVSVACPVVVMVLLCVASARRLATPQTIPVAWSGKLRRSSMIGTRISSLEPKRRPDSSSVAEVSEAESPPLPPPPPLLLLLLLGKKRGRSRFSRRREAAGSAAVRVRDRKRG